LILNRFRIHLGLSLLVGSMALALWADLGLKGWLKSSICSAVNFQTIGLVSIVGLILVMSRLMERSGHMTRLVGSFSLLSKDARVVGAVMPTLIGLLPMPGGALFSAPMVEASLNEHPVSGEQKTIINYWFRHVWEFWWPLYPGVVLALTLLDTNPWRYMGMMAPMTLFSILAGILFILRPIGKTKVPSEGRPSLSEVRRFLWEMMPILVVILVMLLLLALAKGLRALGIYVEITGVSSILPGLVAGVVWVCVVNHVTLSGLRAAVMDKGILPFLLLVFSIMVFKGVMTESQTIGHIRDELMANKIPVLLIIMIMPFVSGLITGIAIGFIGTSFPLVIPLFQALPDYNSLALTAVAYTFGFVGMMVSPVHLCFLVSKDYYKAGLLKSYRYLALPTLTVLAAAIVLYLGVMSP
jgi:integral membrane protein (TIGR00529 family)